MRGQLAIVVGFVCTASVCITPAGAQRAEARALFAQLESPDVSTREHAALALARVGVAAAVDVPALIRALGDASQLVRTRCAGALGGLGSRGEPAIQRLAQLLTDPGFRGRQRSSGRPRRHRSRRDTGTHPRLAQ